MTRQCRPAPAARRTLGIAALLALAAALAVTAVASPAASADIFSPISLVSYGAIDGGTLVQEAEYAHDAAVSANGRYVAFDGSVGGVTGVWRRDLATNAIEQVAGGDAAMPSISENGQYVSFTTNEDASLAEITNLRPDIEPRPEAVSVYRRDMNNAPAATAAEEATRAPTERAFLIASTPVGSGEEPLRYAPQAGETAREGAYAVGRTAMSADGSKVAFVTTAVSDLVPYPAQEEAEREHGETPVPHTPAAQVAVHDFETGTTELVSRCRFGCGQGAAAGAAEPVVASEDESKATGGVAVFGNVFPAHAAGGQSPGASISADGSTVVWLGQNLAQQTPTLAGEGLEPEFQFDVEPLWERLPAANNQARRVTGGSEPESPACAASGETTLPKASEDAADPCQGPFEREPSGPSEGDGFFKANEKFDLTPRLSANGDEVAFVAEARLVTQGSDFGRFTAGHPLDIYVSNMNPELTRTQALRPVTEAGPGGTAASAAVTDFEISPDGKQVAFSTARTEFFLGTPTLISPPPGEPRIAELFDADLADGTLTRITHGYASEAEPSEQPHTTRSQGGDPYAAGTIGPDEVDGLGALSPAFAADGNELVFTSTAANLVYGDGNSPPEPVLCCVAGDGSDVFAVERRQFGSEAPPQYVSPAPSTQVTPSWRLGVTAVSRRDGTVLLYIEAPGAGALHAGAQGTVVAAFVHKPKARQIAKTVATRTVATRTVDAVSPGLMTMTLTLAPRYVARARERGGLSATVTVTFTAPGYPALLDSIPVTFLRTVKPSRSKARRPKSRRRLSKAGGRP
jgi:hypothetical protein